MIADLRSGTPLAEQKRIVAAATIKREKSHTNVKRLRRCSLTLMLKTTH
jgi:hypothetical protein